MPRVRFEPTIPVFEGTKTFHALDRETAVISGLYLTDSNKCYIPIIHSVCLSSDLRFLSLNEMYSVASEMVRADWHRITSKFVS
jgi:hypothetical protein